MRSHENETKSRMTPPEFERRVPLTDLLRDAGDEVSLIFRSTVALLRQELSENVQETRAALIGTIVSVGIIGFGALFVLLGVDFLLIHLLSPQYMTPETAAWVCTLGIGILCLVIGGIVFVMKAKKLQPERLIPSKTLETLEGHADMAKTKSEEIFQ